LAPARQARQPIRHRTRTVFEQIRVEMGAVVWPGEPNLAPDAMHAAIEEHGEWRISPS